MLKLGPSCRRMTDIEWGPPRLANSSQLLMYRWPTVKLMASHIHIRQLIYTSAVTNHEEGNWKRKLRFCGCFSWVWSGLLNNLFFGAGGQNGRKELTTELWLLWNSVCISVWPWTHKTLPASTSQVWELKTCATTLGQNNIFCGTIHAIEIPKSLKEKWEKTRNI